MEEILVIPRTHLKGFLPLRGFLHEELPRVLTLARDHGFYIPRDRAEHDPSLKQLIPYVVFRHDTSIFCYRRLEKGGEKRLHHLLSIGIGGHVRHYHPEAEVNWHMNVARELYEELSITTPFRLLPRGILNEDHEEVCQVHLGMVYEAWVDDPEGIQVRETEELVGNWQSSREIKAKKDAFETWSQILIEEGL